MQYYMYCTVYEIVYCWQLAFKNLLTEDFSLWASLTTIIGVFTIDSNVYSWCTDNTYTYTYKTHHWLLTEAKEPSSITKNACLKACRELFHANLWVQASCFVMVCLLTLIQPVFSDQSADKCSHSESCDSWEFDVGSETTRIKSCMFNSRVKNTY